MSARLSRVGVVAGAMVLAAAAALAQFGGGQLPRGLLGFERDPSVKNPPYDGRFTFARIRYTPGPGGYYYYGLPAWAHGYLPRAGGNRAELSLMKIMDEISYLGPHVEESGVYAFDDPDLFKHPIAYLTEPGFWTMSESESEGLRAYLLKGGFLIVDDFRHDGDPRQGGGWANMEANFRRALPGARFIPVDVSHPIFDSFFHIESFSIIPQSYDQLRPEFWGLFEDNDPGKRLMVMVNYSTDVSDFWEFSATGFRPISESNEAYKLGVNYIMYGLTH